MIYFISSTLLASITSAESKHDQASLYTLGITIRKLRPQDFGNVDGLAPSKPFPHPPPPTTSHFYNPTQFVLLSQPLNSPSSRYISFMPTPPHKEHIDPLSPCTPIPLENPPFSYTSIMPNM